MEGRAGAELDGQRGTTLGVQVGDHDIGAGGVEAADGGFTEA
jgi:hypothetical protein